MFLMLGKFNTQYLQEIFIFVLSKSLITLQLQRYKYIYQPIEYQKKQNIVMQPQHTKQLPFIIPSGLESQLKTLTTILQLKCGSQAQNFAAGQKAQISPLRFLIGICGVPGSGKSTISGLLQQKLNNSIVLPMDGFHLYRKELNEEGLKRRGAAFTFDLIKFTDKLKEIKRGAQKQQESSVDVKIKYPSFDHKLKDPVQDAIQISPETNIIIVQGLYLFDKNLQINQKKVKQDNLWDFKIWIKSDIETCVDRVASRHLQSQIEPTYEQAYNRANSNDRTNALYVTENCFNSEQFLNINEIWVDESGSVRRRYTNSQHQGAKQSEQAQLIDINQINAVVIDNNAVCLF